MVCETCGRKVDEQHDREADAARRERLAYLARDYDGARHWHAFRVNLLQRAEAIMAHCGSRRWCEEVRDAAL